MDNNNENNEAVNDTAGAENTAQEIKVNNNTPTPKKKLGVSKDTQSSSGLPIPAPYKADRTAQFPNMFVFPICKLVKVHFDPAKETKNGVGPALLFVFVALGTPKKQFTHIEFPIEEDDAKWDFKLGALNGRLKHFFDETVGADKFVEGSMEGDDFAEMFKNVANAFNSITYKNIPVGGSEEDAKMLPVFTRHQLYIKLTYGQKSRLQFGLFPNLIQRAMKGNEYIPCELIINSQYDKVIPSETPAINAGGGIGNTGGQTFGHAIDDDDFPDVG